MSVMLCNVMLALMGKCLCMQTEVYHFMVYCSIIHRTWKSTSSEDVGLSDTNPACGGVVSMLN